MNEYSLLSGEIIRGNRIGPANELHEYYFVFSRLYYLPNKESSGQQQHENRGEKHAKGGTIREGISTLSVIPSIERRVVIFM